MTYVFRDAPEIGGSDELVASALDGVAYAENGRLHIKSNSFHYVYKPDGNPKGWYMRNMKNLDDIYLGAGACPSVELETLSVKDETAWNAILAPAQEADNELIEKAKEYLKNKGDE